MGVYTKGFTVSKTLIYNLKNITTKANESNTT
jgi:hypothetical protein